VTNILCLFISLTVAVSAAQVQAPTASVGLKVKGISGQTMRLGAQDLAKMPRVHVSAVAHDGKSHDYEGVELRQILANAGTPTGDALRGKEMSDYVLVEAEDGYRVVFSVAEIDPDFGNRQIVVADKVDGQALSPQDGPLRLVVPEDKRQARWVRMLTTLTIARAP
jgi:DMSO/TMAO reductase YedYZ molybdopterin-dependent catalytic subunit